MIIDESLINFHTHTNILVLIAFYVIKKLEFKIRRRMVRAGDAGKAMFSE